MGFSKIVRKSYLLLAKKVPDLDGSVAVSDGGIDGKVSIHKPHLVPVALGNPSNQVLNVAKGCPNSSTGLSRPKPGIDLELSLPFLVFDQLKIKIQVLEVPCKLPSWAFDFDDSSIDLDLNPIWDIHRFRREDGLHD